MIDSSRVAVLTLALSAALALGAGSASANTITFAAESTGLKPNGFVTAESPIVSFSDTTGADSRPSSSPSRLGSTNQVLGVFSVS